MVGRSVEMIWKGLFSTSTVYKSLSYRRRDVSNEEQKEKPRGRGGLSDGALSITCVGEGMSLERSSTEDVAQWVERELASHAQSAGVSP